MGNHNIFSQMPNTIIKQKSSKLIIKNINSLRKLKSLPITFREKPSKSKVNSHLDNIDKKISTFFTKIKQRTSKTLYFPTIKTMKNNEQKKNKLSSNIIVNKKINNSHFTKKKVQNIKSNISHSTEKNQRKFLKYKNSFIENKEKQFKLKYYLENNNELLLSKEEFSQAYSILKKTVTKNKHPVNSPIAITLGGQPGAGKSNLYSIARERFCNNIVELDCDAFRVYHPYYQQIKNVFGKDDAMKTNPFVFKAVDLLIDELSAEKYNLIIESSLNNPNSALDNGHNLPPKGYKVELQIMATPKNVSWQGTIDRYNQELKRGGSPRAVSKEFHDKVVDNICNSLDIVKKSGLMSNILIYDRNKNCLYDMKKDKKINPSMLLFCVINGYFKKNDEIFMILMNLGKIFQEKCLNLALNI
jgi:UDP-N-acetylglucosamine kinase